MSEYIYEPDETPEYIAHLPSRRPRITAPTADIPHQRGVDRGAVYLQCSCGMSCLTGATLTSATCVDGAPVRHYTAVVVELQPHTVYSMVWDNPDTQPLLHQSRGYVLHQCGGCVSQTPVTVD